MATLPLFSPVLVCCTIVGCAAECRRRRPRHLGSRHSSATDTRITACRRSHRSCVFAWGCGKVGAHVSANPVDGAAGARPATLRSLLSDSSSLRSLSADPVFQACDADEFCSDCLEIDASTTCADRDVGAIRAETCEEAEEVVCCVLENDSSCMDNYLLRAAIGTSSPPPVWLAQKQKERMKLPLPNMLREVGRALAIADTA